MKDHDIEATWDSGDPGEDALDAVLAPADGGLLTAIKESLDLGAGLAQIVGEPPVQEPSPEVPAAGHEVPQSEGEHHHLAQRRSRASAETSASDGAGSLSSRIVLMRARILSLARVNPQPGGTALALLVAAAESLKELKRGLDARELNRNEATALLTNCGRALEQLAAMQQKLRMLTASGSTGSSASWRRRLATPLAMLTIGVATYIGSVATLFRLATGVPHSGHLTHSHALSASGAAITTPLALLLVTMFTGLLVWRAVRKRSRKWEFRGSNAAEVQSLRDDLEILRPLVMRLFDDADEYSAQCTPLV